MASAQFENECLSEHNRLRALHGSPPLRLNRQLCKLADEWAKHLAKSNRLHHRSPNENGENLYMAMGKEVSGAIPVQQWYGELKDYDFKKAQFTPGTGHFTQVVWKNSTELGVGVAKRDKTTYVVCNYKPPGNFKNRFTENVLPPKK